MSSRSEYSEKQYGSDYVITIVDTMTHKKMSLEDIKSVVSASQQSVFKVYHEKIANIIYKISSEEIKTLRTNCDQIETSPVESTEGIEKLLSSIKLSIVQRRFIVDNLSKAKIEAKDIKNTKSQIYTDIISILGIFSALIFALFGGVSMISSIADLAKKVKLGKLIVLASLVSLLLIILIFLLLNGISGMVGKQMKSCCDIKFCSHTLFQRYPFFVSGFITSIFLIFAGGLLILIDSKSLIYIHPYISAAILLIVMVLILYQTYRIFFKSNIFKDYSINKSECADRDE